MTKQETSNQDNEANLDYSVTDILQAHDILISILLGKMIGVTAEPVKMVQIIKDMVEMQEVDDKVKNYIKMLISPISDAINEN